MHRRSRQALGLLCVLGLGWADASLAVASQLAEAHQPAEYVTPPVITVPSLPDDGAPVPAKPPRPPTRIPAFAPDAALTLSRLSQVERDERQFLRVASAIRRFEAEASQLALVKSSNPAVRTFAMGLLQEQSASAVALQRLLHERGMALPMLDNPDRKVLNRLGRLTGTRFDREYLTLVSQRLGRADIPLHERAAGSVDDVVLRSWIEQRLPALRHRLVVAERLVPPAALAGRALAQRPRPAAASGRVAGSTARMGAGRQPAAKPRQRVE